MTKAAKIGMLFPPEREVYGLHSPKDPNTTEAMPCIRCGSLVLRKGSVFSIRDRGTRWRNVDIAAIHTRCVPSGDAPIGIKARSLRASQVRA